MQPPDIPVHIDVFASLAAYRNGEHTQHFQGVPLWKLPADLDRYAKAIADTRPDVVVEVGTTWGGSALWFEQQGVDVVTVDVDSTPQMRSSCVRTTWIVGKSIDPHVLAEVEDCVAGRRVMVSLDSEHSAPHVAQEIRLYGALVSPRCYLVVEDGIFDLAPTAEEQASGGALIPELGGPLHAIASELVDRVQWHRDEDIERMHRVSLYPAGWWVRRD